MVPAGGQIDVLHVSGRLTINDSADEKLHGLFKGGLRVNGIGRIVSIVGWREVVFDHFAPGSFVAACENILELRESLGPRPVQLSSCLDEIWEGLFVEKLHPKRSAVHMDFSFPRSSRKFELFWELRGVIPWPYMAKDGLFLEDAGHLGFQLSFDGCLSLGEIKAVITVRYL